MALGVKGIHPCTQPGAIGHGFRSMLQQPEVEGADIPPHPRIAETASLLPSWCFAGIPVQNPAEVVIA